MAGFSDIDQEIDKLKRDIFSGNWDTMKQSANRLFEIGGQQNLDYLTQLLDQSNSGVRDAVALTFRDNKFNEGLEPLLKSILKEKNRNARGTMVYALQALDCSEKLNDLFYILFSATKNWEVQSGILTILEEQEFEFSADDVKEIQNKWNEIRGTWDEANGIDKSDLKKVPIDWELVQGFVDGFVSYLEVE